MNIAVCDDQIELVDQLGRSIKTFLAGQNRVLGSVKQYTDGMALLADYKAGLRFDVIFLDIEMPSISGIEVAGEIRKLDEEVLLIFVTSYPDYMPASFKVETFDFLTKPVSVEEIQIVLTRCMRKYEQRHSQLLIKTPLGVAAVTLHKIVFVRSTLHYVDFILRDAREPLHSKLKLNEVETMLQPYHQFVRCHQSYIVNLDYVQELQRQKILLNITGLAEYNTLPISRKYITVIKEKFLRYHLKSGRV